MCGFPYFLTIHSLVYLSACYYVFSLNYYGDLVLLTTLHMYYTCIHVFSLMIDEYALLNCNVDISSLPTSIIADLPYLPGG
jgi:hypothetical protein